jgi:pilus assembly protein CpaF
MTMTWDYILPFLRPIEPLLRDPEISDILVNGSSGVFAEKNGVLFQVPGVRMAEQPLQVAVRNIARVLGDEISAEKPLLDARLPDGSRVAAVFPPCSVGGTALAIRKFQTSRYDVSGLVQVGAVTEATLERLREAVATKQNILISGRTGAGKTTILSALATFIAKDERIVVIEDTSELQIAHVNLVRFEARRAQPDLPAVTIRDLLKATLRLRPDRILLGEIRGEEAFDLLQALNTGHRGTLSTTHANSAAESLERLATCAFMADVRLPHAVIRRQIGFGLQLLVHLDVQGGRRQVREVVRVAGYDATRDRYDLEVVYGA